MDACLAHVENVLSECSEGSVEGGECAIVCIPLIKNDV